ncbi:MAG: hypothetical protein HC850_13370 [Rhodomicrobium sp.]|nr:hypothetical protein [Rhodomicrobium sp.]
MIPLELQRRIVDDAIHNQNLRYMLLLCGVYLVVLLIQGGLKYMLNVGRGRLVERVAFQLRGHVSTCLWTSQLKRQENATNVDKGAVVSITSSEVEEVAGFVGDSISFPLLQAGTAFGTLGYLFWVQPEIAAFAVAMLASVPLSRYLLGRVAKQGAETKETRADRVMANISGRLKRWSLKATLKGKARAGLWVAGAFGLFVLSMVAATRVPLVLYPDADGLNLGINIELPPSTTLETSQDIADQVGEILRDKPYFDSIIKLVGRKSPLASASILSALEPSQSENFIGFSITFVEREDRGKPSYELVNEIRSELKSWLDANVAGANLLVVGESGGPSAGDPISIDITGTDMAELQRLSAEVQGILEGISGTTDVRDNLGSVKTEIALTPNREAADFSVSASRISHRKSVSLFPMTRSAHSRLSARKTIWKFIWALTGEAGPEPAAGRSRLKNSPWFARFARTGKPSPCCRCLSRRYPKRRHPSSVAKATVR